MAKCLEILNKFSDSLTHHCGSKELGNLAPTSSIENPKKDSVLFIPSMDKLDKAINSEALLLIIDQKLKDKISNIDFNNKTVFLSNNLQVSMAKINQEFFTPTNYKKAFNKTTGVHKSAFVADSVKLGKNVTIGPGASVNDDCVLSDNVYIGPNAVVEAGCSIGEGTHIFPLVFIGHGTTIGKNCKIQSNSSIGTDGFGYGQTKLGEHIFKPHIGNVILEDNVDIGAGVFIDRGTYDNSIIGEGTKIDNNCHFGHNIVMGKHNLVTGGFITAGSVTIGDHCVFGGRTTVSGHLKIASQVMLGGLTGVTKSILKPGMYAGYPLQKLKDNLKTVASLPHLPELRKAIKKLSSKAD